MPNSPVEVEAYYSPSTLTLDLVFRVNISWVSVNLQDENASEQFLTTPQFLYLQESFIVTVAHEAILYHYKDSKSELDFHKRLVEQIIKTLRGVILYGKFLPKKVLELVLETSKSLLSINIADWLSKYECGWIAFKQQGIPTMEDYSYNQVEPLVYPGSNSDTSAQLAALAKMLPGVKEIVRYPCDCRMTYANDTLYRVIMHLNDMCGWSRERVADWIETLDVDTTFKSEPVEIK